MTTLLQGPLTRRLVMLALVLGAVALPGISSAQARLDHRGAVGLVVAPGLEHASLLYGPRSAQKDTWIGLLEAGPTLAVGDEGDEITLRFRLEKALTALGAGACFGYRSYFGRDQWKTFVDLDLKGDTIPSLTAGPRVGLGVMYEASPIVGLYATVAGSAEFGQGVRGAGEALLGVQARSYLLE